MKNSLFTIIFFLNSFGCFGGEHSSVWTDLNLQDYCTDCNLLDQGIIDLSQAGIAATFPLYQNTDLDLNRAEDTGSDHPCQHPSIRDKNLDEEVARLEAQLTGADYSDDSWISDIEESEVEYPEEDYLALKRRIKELEARHQKTRTHTKLKGAAKKRVCNRTASALSRLRKKTRVTKLLTTRRKYKRLTTYLGEMKSVLTILNQSARFEGKEATIRYLEGCLPLLK